MKVYSGLCVGGLGVVAAVERDSLRAARLLGAGQGLIKAFGQEREPVDQLEFDRATDLARAQLGDIAFAAAWEEGAKMSPDEATTFALSH